MSYCIALLSRIFHVTHLISVHYLILQTNDSTTLHLAAAGGHKEVVKVLLEAGAAGTDENAVSLSGKLVLISKSSYSLEGVTLEDIWITCVNQT